MAIAIVRIQLHQPGVPHIIPAFHVRTSDPAALKAWTENRWPQHEFTETKLMSEEEYKTWFEMQEVKGKQK